MSYAEDGKKGEKNNGGCGYLLLAFFLRFVGRGPEISKEVLQIDQFIRDGVMFYKLAVEENKWELVDSGPNLIKSGAPIVDYGLELSQNGYVFTQVNTVGEKVTVMRLVHQFDRPKIEMAVVSDMSGQTVEPKEVVVEKNRFKSDKKATREALDMAERFYNLMLAKYRGDDSWGKISSFTLDENYG